MSWIKRSLFGFSVCVTLILTGCFGNASKPPRHDPREIDDIVVEPTPTPTPLIAKEKTPVKSSKSAKTLPLIVIDPGHGGEDDGAHGPNGLQEKAYVLDMAKRVGKLVEQFPAEVALTRETDEFIPLSGRTGFANRTHATIFISLHANASPQKKASGLQTYYLDNAHDEASKLLAERENASGGEAPVGDLDFILSDVIQSGKLDDSIELAHILHRSVQRSLGKRYQGIRDLGVKKAPFYVLVGAHMPCILVEMFFIDSPKDSVLIQNERFRNDLASALTEGIRAYLKKRKLL